MPKLSVSVSHAQYEFLQMLDESISKAVQIAIEECATYRGYVHYVEQYVKEPVNEEA